MARLALGLARGDFPKSRSRIPAQQRSEFTSASGYENSLQVSEVQAAPR